MAESLARTEAELRAEKAAALGLVRHDDVDRHYPPPEPLSSPR